MPSVLIVLAVATGAVVLATLHWWRSQRVRRSDDQNLYGSGLNRQQWYALASLTETITGPTKNQESQLDAWRQNFLALAPEVRQSLAGQHLHQFLFASQTESLDLAIQALVPGSANPWLVVSKSL